jgi:hypothetical protein
MPITHSKSLGSVSPEKSEYYQLLPVSHGVFRGKEHGDKQAVQSNRRITKPIWMYPGHGK